MNYSTESLTNPAFLAAQRASLSQWHSDTQGGADLSFEEWLDCFPDDRPLPGIDLTTSSGRETYLEEWLQEHDPEASKRLEELCAEEGMPVACAMSEGVWDILTDALFSIDTLRDAGALFPVHSCHHSIVASAVLARLEHPTEKLTVISNDFHSTVMVGDDVTYFDPLVSQRACDSFMSGDSKQFTLDITDIPVEDIAKAVIQFMSNQATN